MTLCKAKGIKLKAQGKAIILLKSSWYLTPLAFQVSACGYDQSRG